MYLSPISTGTTYHNKKARGRNLAPIVLVPTNVMSTVKCYLNVILNLFQDLLVIKRLRVKPAITQ